jgi:hypothetical protein
MERCTRPGLSPLQRGDDELPARVGAVGIGPANDHISAVRPATNPAPPPASLRRRCSFVFGIGWLRVVPEPRVPSCSARAGPQITKVLRRLGRSSRQGGPRVIPFPRSADRLVSVRRCEAARPLPATAASQQGLTAATEHRFSHRRSEAEIDRKWPLSFGGLPERGLWTSSMARSSRVARRAR